MPLHALLADVIPFGRYAGRSWDSIESDREHFRAKHMAFRAEFNSILRQIKEANRAT